MSGDSAGRYAVSTWNEMGAATLEASGPDRRSAFEAALQAVLTLAVNGPAVIREPAEVAEARAAPIRGEGDDLPSLFSDLVEDLLVQLEEPGAAVRDVTLDGLLRRDDGGFIAWGYAITEPGASWHTLIRLHQSARVAEDATGITVQATLERESAS